MAFLRCWWGVALLPRLLRRMGLLAVLVSTAGLGASAPTEYQLKAVFLYNFAHFVEWPTSAFPSGEAPFVIGVLGKDPFGSALEETVRGETVRGRPFTVRRFKSLEDLEPCQILFIDSSVSAMAQESIEAVRRLATLTVADVGPQMPSQVVIGFVNDNKKIRLRINVDSARDAGLVISSQLLRPAQIISGDPG